MNKSVIAFKELQKVKDTIINEVGTFNFKKIDLCEKGYTKNLKILLSDLAKIVLKHPSTEACAVARYKYKTLRANIKAKEILQKV